jgi:hypothetical protein
MDALKQRINEQLNGENGIRTEQPDTPLDMEERREMQQQLLGTGKEQEDSQKQGRDVRPQGTERNR